VLPTITTPRLRLRAIRPDDAADIFAVFSDPVVVRYWSLPPLADLAAASAMIDRIERHAEARSLLQWGIVRADDDRVLGTCTLADIDLAHRRAGLGYALARTAWGQGFAREAVRAVIGFGFRELDLHRIGADVDPRNTASLRLLDDLGFCREGVQRECYFVMDEWQDAVLFGLLRREWAG
jgi:ribosomal-protein-alanine N-acetyltransferase